MNTRNHSTETTAVQARPPAEAPNSRVEWALYFASKGLGILRIQSGAKEPFKDGGVDEATTDSAVIRAWFEENPGMNYGINPGDHHLVIDLDRKPGADGYEAFNDIQAGQNLDDWLTDQTFTQQTPSGGYHLFTKAPYPVGNSDREWPAGINVRGARGYVVGPGCTVNGATYTPVAQDQDIMRAPDWVMARCRKAGERTEKADDPLFEQDTPAAIERARDFLSRREPAVEGQGGDEHTYATTCLLRDIGLSPDKALEVMCEPNGWNDKCEPPWDAEELGIKVRNAYSYARKQPGSKADGGDVFRSAFGDDGEAQDIAELDARDRQRQRGRLDDMLARTSHNGAAADALEPARFIVPRLLRHGVITGINATRGLGKTTFGVDLACRIASDMDWHGREVEPGYHAFLFLGEDAHGAQDFVKAWIATHGEPRRLHRLDELPDLTDREDCELFAAYIRAATGGEPAVGLFDTFERCLGDADQSDFREMGQALTNLESIILPALQGAAVIVTHPPEEKPTKMFGSSRIANRVACHIQGEKTYGGVKFTIPRMKGVGEGDYHLFERRPVDIGTDQFGNTRSGYVMHRIGGTEAEDSSDQFDPEREALVDAIVRTINDHYEGDEGQPMSTNRLAERMANQTFGDGFQAPGKRAVQERLGKLPPAVTVGESSILTRRRDSRGTTRWSLRIKPTANDRFGPVDPEEEREE